MTFEASNGSEYKARPSKSKEKPSLDCSSISHCGEQSIGLDEPSHHKFSGQTTKEIVEAYLSSSHTAGGAPTPSAQLDLVALESQGQGVQKPEQPQEPAPNLDDSLNTEQQDAILAEDGICGPMARAQSFSKIKHLAELGSGSCYDAPRCPEGHELTPKTWPYLVLRRRLSVTSLRPLPGVQASAEQEAFLSTSSSEKSGQHADKGQPAGQGLEQVQLYEGSDSSAYLGTSSSSSSSRRPS